MIASEEIESLFKGINEVSNDQTENIRSNNEFDHNLYWKGPFNIQVILVGPFTKVQKDIAMRKTSVDVHKVLAALKWLKKHNILYRDLDIGEEHICSPKVIDLSNTVESHDSNVERGFSYKVVFIDHNEPTQGNGGYKTCQEFKETAMKENLLNIKTQLSAEPPATLFSTTKIKTCIRVSLNYSHME